MSRLFYQRALFLDGYREEAQEQFNSPKACTPTIALCKEPSQEHRRHPQELVEAGADMDLVDERGYTALDHAVFNGDTAAEELVLKGLRHQLDGDVEAKVLKRQMQAKLRKGYRELFQERLRLVLLGGSGSDDLQVLRHVYADALGADEKIRGMFDGFKFIRYCDFLRFGKIPRSNECLAQEWVSSSPTGGSTKLCRRQHQTIPRVHNMNEWSEQPKS